MIRDGIKYIVFPIVFFLIVISIAIIIFLPKFLPYQNLIELAFFNEVPAYNEQRGIMLPSSAVDEEAPELNIIMPSVGAEFGTIIIKDAGVDAPIYYGDDSEELRKGVGTSTGAWIPGQGRTIIMGAHNDSFFLNLPKASIGNTIEINTSYGDFYYHIDEMRVTRFDDETIYDLSRDDEVLILYTCVDSIPFGATPWRLIVTATPIGEAVIHPNGESQ